MRRIAKIMNFGVLYGLSAFGISRQTDLSADEGTFFIEAYFGKYPGIQDYIESTKEKVRKQGYVETLKGRRRYIYEIQSRSYTTRAAGERMAMKHADPGHRGRHTQDRHGPHQESGSRLKGCAP